MLYITYMGNYIWTLITVLQFTWKMSLKYPLLMPTFIYFPKQ